MADLYRLDSSALPDDVRLVHAHVFEAMSKPFHIVVHFSTKSPDDVDLADVIAAKATLTMDRGEGSPRMQWGGVFAAIEHLHQIEKVAYFRGVIVPAPWFLASNEHSRVFTASTLADIAKAIFDENGVQSSEYDLRAASTPSEELVIQYRESDLAFLHRWFEREGWFYWFSHDDDGPKMVVDDKNPSESLRSDTVRYFPTLGHDATRGEALTRFRARRNATLAGIKLRDYDYTKPALDVAGKADASPTGVGELVRFGDRFFNSDDGGRVAKKRAEALLAGEETYVASGTATQLRVGYVFELDEHPSAAFNKKYLVTRAEHVLVERSVLDAGMRDLLGLGPSEGEHTYHVEIEALDASVAYRAPHATPWPRISGQELATIDGEADSEYAQLDSDGRYLVKFMFDESDHDAGKASTRVRMMQPHGGNPEGFHFPLRKGTEVVVIFLGGDPDRPVIAGTVPNATTPSPITSSNHTRNILITGGRNKIEMEDQDGDQFINIYTPTQNTEIHMGSPKDFKKVGKSGATVKANLGEHTDGDAVFTFGGDWRIDVGKEKEEHIKSNVTEDYDASVTQTYKGPKVQDVTNNVTEHFHAHHTTTVDTGRTLTVNGHCDETYTGGVTQTINPNMVQTIGDVWRHVTGTSETYAPTFNEHFGNYTTDVTGTWKATAPTTKHDLGSWTLNAKDVDWKTGSMKWKAPDVTLNIPSWNNVGASWFTTGDTIGSMYTATISINKALAFSLQSIYVQINPVALTVTPALNIALKGFFLENKGINLVQHGAKFSFAGIHSFA